MYHPQIIRMIQLFEAESQPFRKVHRMIDLFETIIKTHSAVIVSNYFQQKDINDDIKELLEDIEDEDDRDQIELWVRKVKKGKMTEQEFEEKVKDLLL